MDFGQFLMVLGIIGFLHSLFAMGFPEFSSKIFRAIGFNGLCGTAEKVKKTAYWEFLISLVIFVIGMNL